MKTCLDDFTDMIRIEIAIAAVISLGFLLPIREVGVEITLKTVLIYMAATAIMIVASYLATILSLWRTNTASDRRILVPSIATGSVIILNIVLLVQVLAPWMYRQAGLEMPVWVETALFIYVVLATLTMLFVIGAVKALQNENREQIIVLDSGKDDASREGDGV